MTKNQLVSLLESSGLSENQARVYLANLALGASNVSDIANEAGIKRTTVYSVVESLQGMGLIFTEFRGLKKLHSAADPGEIEKIIESKKQAFQDALPALSSFREECPEEGTFKLYNGLDSVKAVYNSLLVLRQ